MRGSSPRMTKSKRRFQLQMIEPVDRFDADAALFAPLLNIERHRRAGCAGRPDLAVEVREAARRLAADTDDLVALADAGSFSWSARRHARHQQTPAHVGGGQSEP